jgi:endonuclease YncB( thermonuclease family)
LRSLRLLAVLAAGALAVALSMVFAGGRIMAGFGRGDAPALQGKPVVVDGDSLTLGARRIRLLHVDACEIGQPATRGGDTFDCGGWARAAMAALIGDSRLACENHGLDRYGRVLAHCSTGDGVNIALAAVRAGIAFVGDPRRAPKAFTEAEHQARARGLGVWGFSVERPDAYRRRSA